MIVMNSPTNGPGSKAALPLRLSVAIDPDFTARSVLFLEIERGRVHTVAQTARLRAVRENVPQVRIALSAQRFHAPHPVAVVLFRAHSSGLNRSIEARPAGPGLELRI